MIELTVTFKVKLYEGRLEPPYDRRGNWDLWFYDNFVQTALNGDMLRPGEHISLESCEETKLAEE